MDSSSSSKHFTSASRGDVSSQWEIKEALGGGRRSTPMRRRGVSMRWGGARGRTRQRDTASRSAALPRSTTTRFRSVHNSSSPKLESTAVKSKSVLRMIRMYVCFAPSKLKTSVAPTCTLKTPSPGRQPPSPRCNINTWQSVFLIPPRINSFECWGLSYIRSARV